MKVGDLFVNYSFVFCNFPLVGVQININNTTLFGRHRIDNLSILILNCQTTNIKSSHRVFYICTYSPNFVKFKYFIAWFKNYPTILSFHICLQKYGLIEPRFKFQLNIQRLCFGPTRTAVRLTASKVKDCLTL